MGGQNNKKKQRKRKKKKLELRKIMSGRNYSLGIYVVPRFFLSLIILPLTYNKNLLADKDWLIYSHLQRIDIVF
jgi:hypothetical protein